MQKYDTPLVSVITPCYNGEKYLSRYFESLLAQTYDNIELIFINDGSTDKTKEIYKSYEERLHKKRFTTKYLEQENGGISIAVNNALKQFTGEYLTLPDADDYMYPNCIRAKVECLQKNPDSPLVCVQGQEVPEGDINTILRVVKRDPHDEDSFLHDALFGSPNFYYEPVAYMIRSEAFLAVFPDREIFHERGTSQNRQILAPISNYGKPCFVDEILFKYVIRLESRCHSFGKSYETMMHRYAYTERSTQYTLEKVGLAQDEKYVKEKIVKFARQRLMAAFTFGKREEFIKQYHILQGQNVITMSNRIMYLMSYIPNGAKIYNAVRQIVK